MFGDFLDFLANGVFDFLNGLLGIFPQMPLTADTYEEFVSGDLVLTVLGWVNYLLPIQIASGIIATWAAAMMAYISIKLAKKYATSIVG